MQYATLYVMDPSLIGSKVLDQLPQILSYSSKSSDDSAIGMVVKLDAATIEMNFMETEKLEEHLEGLKGFACKHVSQGTDLIYMLSRIHYIQIAIGCVIKPDFDEKYNALDFLSKLNKACNSLLFCDNKLFDYDMEILAKL